ncbi:tetratricopeptide repeat protein [Sphaerotilus microaerophilus]|uniref:Tetratricopeptide repeat protein n=1 Tax=Sphaerotilus microaerophilus TaxID=2914710 RepID=A0ABN6PED4_9BURK|nr:tetratricopeptide repeat protein [Sphaerotilus sp. FB-5]BDI03308.1 hypothetical protein CATMQ487_02780 [Sphaerotilus sp. FB-5]
MAYRPSDPSDRSTGRPWRRARQLHPALSLALSSCLLTAGLPLATAWLAPATALAATPAAARDLSADAKAAAAETVFNAAATLDAFKREADDRLRGQRRQIEGLQTRLKTAEAQRQTDVSALRSELAQAQERFVAELAARDRTYAREIAVFRSTVEDIAATPEGAEALRQYNAGDEAGALAVLDSLADAREQARKARAALETAAERRRIATLALDARDKGKVDTLAVIKRYEEVTRLDPGWHWDWVELSRLYAEANRLQQAQAAAQRSADTAQDNRDLAVALDELGKLLAAQGDGVGARARFEESLDIFRHLAAVNPSLDVYQRDFAHMLRRLGDLLIRQGELAAARVHLQGSLAIRQRLAAANPGSADDQRDHSLILSKLGDLLLAEGDPAAARAHFEDSLAITRRLAAAHPGSANAQRDLSIGLERLGDRLLAQRDLAGARALFEEDLAISQRLAAADPGSASAQRDLSVSLNKIGDLLLAQRDFSGARARFQDSLAIRQRLAAADPASATAQRDVRINQNRLGDLLFGQGDLAGAHTHFQASLAIAQRLAAADPSSAQAQAQREVWLTMWRLRQLPDSGITWAQIAQAIEAQQARGTLLPGDQRYLDDARQRAQREQAPSAKPP